MNKKRYLTLMAMIFGALLLAGCSKKTSTYAVEYKSGSVDVKRDGSIEVTYREEFDEKRYDKNELEQAAKEEIEEFNSKYSSDNGMAFKSLLVRKNRAKLVVTFATADDYVLYNKKYVDSEREIKMFVGTYEEAVAAGYEPSDKLYSVKGKKKTKIDKSDIDNIKDLMVVYTTKGTSVKVDGKYKYVNKYVSFEKIEDTDEYIANTSDMSQNYILFESK